MGPIACAGCDAALSPGAHFCHRCGQPVAATFPSLAPTGLYPTPRGGSSSPLPWAVAAIALLALLAMSAGRFFNSSSGGGLDAPRSALPQTGPDERSDAASGGTSAIRAPDISALSPQEQAERLFNRVMLLNSQGKTDSVLFFAPMAISVYQMLSPLSADQRYDMGRIAEVSGALPLARAQADTILLANPNHLLGLVLSVRVASLSGDAAARKRYETRLLAAEKTETAKKLPEYDLHQNDINNALGDARRSVGNRR
jgi:hypothetical protein